MRFIRPIKHLRRVVAQEVDRLAHLADGIGEGLARLAHDQADQRQQARFHPVGDPPQAIRPRLGRGIPDHGAGAGGIDQLRRRLDDGADQVAGVGRIAQLAGGAVARPVAQHRLGAPALATERLVERREALLVGEIEPHRIGPLRAEQVARQGDPVVRPANRLECPRLLDRIGQQLIDRKVRIGDLVHERGVGAILEQPAHEIGEQGLVRADRRIDAARHAELARPDDLLVKALAHAMQALELVPSLGCDRVDRRQAERIVRRDLREHRVGRRQQLPRTGDVGHVGVDLAREDRKSFQPVELGALDLAVPIGALDQPHHQAMAAAPRQVDQPVDHERAALLVGLHDEADAVPARQLRLEAEPLEQVERQLEPVGLLGVDVEADIERMRLHCQRLQPRIELGMDALDLAAAVARMQRRELYRDAGAVVDAAPGRRGADRLDRGLVLVEVPPGLRRGHRRLTEHVVGIAEALPHPRAAIVQGLVDRLAGDELLAHQAHGQVHARADQRLAASRHQPGQRRRQPALAVGRRELAGQQQAPGRRIHEQRRALAEMGLPVAAADLVADQRVARLVVWNPQQRLGQAHQRHALLARERIFVDQPLDAAAMALRPHPLDQPPRQRCRRLHGPGRQGGGGDQRRQAFGLGPPVGGRYRFAERTFERRRGHVAHLVLRLT